ncbi:phosphate ABC transporter permease subunit PstC [Sedimentibacter sp. MB31-C6]|uniref:phosphate ABC transporter permease subunit PstC n=1 Tax=Sedimentibacter sp. MB31-C6 TaxID=3109366 RepID=UPI002DDCDC19|nr:phosphate ABC transporter permease subunit PstC [Sedimentibacter sp. MB36-C1]WSI03585.1 phosphate ABC transporter permease subunit PstC [Sedimentibacter sp. MB36-C1]
MKDYRENIFRITITIGAILSSLLVLLVFFYILKESLPFFKEVNFREYILGYSWSPLSSKPNYSFLPMILATLYISFLAILIATPLSIGCALFLSFNSNKKYSKVILSFIDMIAGIPSVIFGFLGLVILVKFLEKNLNMVTGESVLAGGILLSVMLFPYIVTGCTETFIKGKKVYYAASQSLGVSKWYTMRKIMLPFAVNSIFVNMLLAFGRAIGETMAVMMVTGNSPIFPKLFGRAETIPSLIALEMGTATYKSIHYSSLYAAGLILIIIILIIQLIAYMINKTGTRHSK